MAQTVKTVQTVHLARGFNDDGKMIDISMSVVEEAAVVGGPKRKQPATIREQMDRWSHYVDYLAKSEGRESEAYTRAVDYLNIIRRECEARQRRA